MARPKVKQNQIRAGLIGLELKALSLVLDGWSQNSNVSKKMATAKVQAFRDAMMTGLKSGGKEGVEYEIVYDEYQVMLGILKPIHGSKPDDVVECRFSPKGEEDYIFRRAFPCPEKEFSNYAGSIKTGRKSEVIVRELVARRLDISMSTVKNATNSKKKRRFDTTPEQRLLVSVFFDTSSFLKNEERLACQTVLLDTLLSTGYPRIATYYLIQGSHELQGPLALRPNSLKEIEQLCDAVCSESERIEGGFRKLIVG